MSILIWSLIFMSNYTLLFVQTANEIFNFYTLYHNYIIFSLMSICNLQTIHLRLGLARTMDAASLLNENCYYWFCCFYFSLLFIFTLSSIVCCLRRHNANGTHTICYTIYCISMVVVCDKIRPNESSNKIFVCVCVCVYLFCKQNETNCQNTQLPVSRHGTLLFECQSTNSLFSFIDTWFCHSKYSLVAFCWWKSR